MPQVADAIAALERLAPLALAEEWDNVGLLAGNPLAPLQRAMTCLTLTPDVAIEAIETGAQLVVTHHPLPFRPIAKLTTADTTGETLWRLAGAGIAVYSAHTAYDSCVGGVNDQLAEVFELTDTAPLQAATLPLEGGAGRIGICHAQKTLADLARTAESELGAHTPRLVGRPETVAGRVAVACGSGGSLLDLALGADCDTFVTGEASFHDCLKARTAGVGVVLLGHYASEHFALRTLAERLAAALPGVDISSSEAEQDPLVRA